MSDAHKDAKSIKRNITKQSSETARSADLTPSPEQQRAGYKYPFSSLIQQRAISTQQANMSPSREITQAIETATETALSSENTPVTARSEVSPRREIILIESSLTPAPPLPRRSTRANIGIPPDRYHDPKQKLLAVERDEHERVKAKESGGNNITEGRG
jgi:hypothetical protein